MSNSRTSSSRPGSRLSIHSQSQHSLPLFDIGDSVKITSSGVKGIVRFIGLTKFSEGIWIGLELPTPTGKNNGSLEGTGYFECPRGCGVFIRGGQLSMIDTTSRNRTSITGSRTSITNRAAEIPSATKREAKVSTDKPESKTIEPNLALPEKPTSRRGSRISSERLPQEYGIGDKVLITTSYIHALVRYIGPTEFAEGVWLGIELESKAGKNDGSVGGKRYFSCEDGFGMFIRAAQVQLVTKYVAIPGEIKETAITGGESVMSKTSSRASSNSSDTSIPQPGITRKTDNSDTAALATRSKSVTDVKRGRLSKSKTHGGSLEEIPEGKTVSEVQSTRNASKSSIPSPSRKKSEVSINPLEPLTEVPGTPKKPKESLSAIPTPTRRPSVKLSEIDMDELKAFAPKIHAESSFNPTYDVDENELKILVAENLRKASAGFGSTIKIPEFKGIKQTANSASKLESVTAVPIRRDVIPDADTHRPNYFHAPGTDTKDSVLNRRDKVAAESQNIEMDEGLDAFKPKKNSSSTFDPSYNVNDRQRNAMATAEMASENSHGNALQLNKDSRSKPDQNSRSSSRNSVMPEAAVSSSLNGEAAPAGKTRTYQEYDETSVPLIKGVKDKASQRQSNDALALSKQSSSLSFVDIEGIDAFAPKKSSSSCFNPSYDVNEKQRKALALENMAKAGFSPIDSITAETEKLKKVTPTIKAVSERKESLKTAAYKPELESDGSMIGDYEDSELESIERSRNSSRSLTGKRNSNIREAVEASYPAELIAQLKEANRLVRDEYESVKREKIALENEMIKIVARHEAETVSNTSELIMTQLKSEMIKVNKIFDAVKKQNVVLEKELLNTAARHDAEVTSMKKSLEVVSQAKASYDALQAKQNATLLELDNSLLHNDRMQKELKSAKQECLLMQAEMDLAKYSADLAVIDRSVLEEQISALKGDLKELSDANEEMSLQIELEGSKLSAPSAVDKTGLLNLNNRLTEALIKLRDISDLREIELEEKIKLRDKTIERFQLLDVEKLDTANKTIINLKSQTNGFKNSTMLIASLKETKADMDKTTDAEELEELRKVNNQLEEVQLAIEAHLQAELEIKDQMIEEIVERYSYQQTLLAQAETLTANLLRESILTKPEMVDQEEFKLLKQQVRVSESVFAEKTLQLQQAQITLSNFQQQADILMVCVEKVLHPITKKRIQCYLNSRAISKKSKLLISNNQIDSANIFQMLLDLQSSAAVLMVLSEFDGNISESELDLGSDVTLVAILDKILKKLEIGDLTSIESTLSSVSWFADATKPLWAKFLDAPNLVFVQYSVILDSILLKSVILNTLSGNEQNLKLLSPINTFSASLINSCKQLEVQLSNYLGDGQCMAIASFQAFRMLEEEFELAWIHSMDLILDVSLIEQSKLILLGVVDSGSTVNAKLDAFYSTCKFDSIGDVTSEWEFAADDCRNRLNQLTMLKNNFDTLEEKYENAAYQSNVKVGALELKIDILERQLEPLVKLPETC